MRSRSLPFSLVGVVILTLVTCGAGAWATDEPTSLTLENGLRVRLVPLENEERVFVILGVRAGFFDEPAGLPHLAHVTEHLVVFGAPGGSDEAEATERWSRAGRVNGETLPGWMYFDLQVEPGELESALRVQATRLANPQFTEEVLAREVPRTLQELEHLEESETSGTGKFAFSAFVQATRHGRDEAPIKAGTKSITIEDVRRFHAAHFRPDRAMLCLVGGFDPARARKAIVEVFGPIPKSEGAPGRPRLRQGDTDRTARWDALTRHLILAWPTPPASTPEHAALSLAAEALSARLPTAPDLAGLAKMPLVTNEIEGLFLINVQAKPGADLDALTSKLLEQVGKLSTPQGFNEVQVALARNGLLQVLRPGGLRSLLLSLGGSRLMYRTNSELRRMDKEIAWGNPDAYAGRVEALNGPEVRAAIAGHLAPGQVIIVRVEPDTD